jgi:hypothetical protein
MHTCRINNETIQYPSDWDQLTHNQLFYIIHLANKSLTEMEFRLKSFLAFTGLKVAHQNPVISNGEIINRITSGKKQFFLTNIQLNELARSLDFILEENQGKLSLNSRLTINPVKKIRFGKTFYGPADKLFNLTLEEYIVCEELFDKFHASREDEYFDKLIATLWRPKNKGIISQYVEDIRSPYEDRYTTAYCRRLKNLKQDQKTAIYLFYAGCRKFLRHRFPDVFKSASGGSDDGLGMLSLVDALCGDDVTKVDQVRKSYLYDVMIRLQRAAVAKQQMEEQLKQMKRNGKV